MPSDQTPPEPGGDLGDEDHDPKGEPQAQQLGLQPFRVLVDGAEEHQQAIARRQQQGKDQGQV